MFHAYGCGPREALPKPKPYSKIFSSSWEGEEERAFKEDWKGKQKMELACSEHSRQETLCQAPSNCDHFQPHPAPEAGEIIPLPDCRNWGSQGSNNMPEVTKQTQHLQPELSDLKAVSNLLPSEDLYVVVTFACSLQKVYPTWLL